MNASARLSKDVFLALFAVAWADGHVHADEADAIVRCAVDEGLELDEIDAIERAAREPVALEAVDRTALSREDRVFIYAVAWWVAKMDGVVTGDEARTLAALGEDLAVPDRARVIAEAIAAEVASLPDGDRPSRYDLSKVRRIIGERLTNTTEARRDPG